MSFLRSLSDNQILSKITELVSRERSLTRGVLLHLNEIERRKLHLKLGYASMFDYCTTGLGYSSSAAARRIRTARCMARFPEVLALLKSNEVNLSTVSQVSRILTAENKDALLQRIRGKSQREVDVIVAEYEPRALPPERVRPIVVQVQRTTTEDSSLDVTVAATEGLLLDVPTGRAAQTNCSLTNELQDEHCRSGSELSPYFVSERRMMLSFSASEEFMAKLEKIKSLAWHRLPANATLEQVFELAMQYFIDGEDPAVRQERRDARKERSSKNKEETERESNERRPRHVAAAVKNEVFTRDTGRCTYVGADGRRCASTQALQFDHIQPVARGGSGTPGNLRLLCAYHNRLEAERILGARGRFQGAQRAPTNNPKQSRSTSKKDDSSTFA